jgi:hypothetical protein
MDIPHTPLPTSISFTDLEFIASPDFSLCNTLPFIAFTKTSLKYLERHHSPAEHFAVEPVCHSVKEAARRIGTARGFVIGFSISSSQMLYEKNILELKTVGQGIPNDQSHSSH